MPQLKRGAVSSAPLPLPADAILIGRVGAPFGVQGFVHIHSFTEIPQQVLGYQPWIVFLNGRTLESEIVDIKQQDAAIRVRFKDCMDRTAAQAYTNATIYVAKTQLPSLPTGEYYWTDLEGLDVFHQDGRALGQVAYLLNAGAHDILVVTKKGEKGELLIPFIPTQVIVSIDLTNHKITVAWDIEE
jgi:16S rRNA processing protein RimM